MNTIMTKIINPYNIEFKKGDSAILRSSRFKNKFAEIKDIEAENKIATVTTAEGETYRVDFDEMYPYNETPDISELSINSVEDEKGEYRPVGRGYGKERDAFNVAASAIRKLEKTLGKTKVPIVAVKYESTEQRKWRNGVKHNATVKVPVVGGQVKNAEYLYDNLNRKYKLDSEGIQNFLEQINWDIEENKDESIYQNPGTVPSFAGMDHISFTKTAEAKADNKTIDILTKMSKQNTKKNIKKESEKKEYYSDEKGNKIGYDDDIGNKGGWFIFYDNGYKADYPIIYPDGNVGFDNPYQIPKYLKNKFKMLVNKYGVKPTIANKIDYKQKLITAQNPLFHARKIMTDEDYNEFKKLLALRDMYLNEIEMQEQYNESRGVDKGHRVNYKKLNQINKSIDNVLSKYHNSIDNYFMPQEASVNPVDKIVSKILKKSNINKKAEEIDEEMISEKEEDETVPGKRKETKHKKIPHNTEDDYQPKDSPVPSGIGNREFNDKTELDLNETRFIS